MAAALAELKRTRAALVKEHKKALKLSEDWENAQPGDKIYPTDVSEGAARRKCALNVREPNSPLPPLLSSSLICRASCTVA
jgi:hypothetical protein